MQRSQFLFRLFWLLMLVFFVGRLGFMFYNTELWPSADDPTLTGFANPLWLWDIFVTTIHGAYAHDLLVVCVLIAFPAFLWACGVKRLRLWLTPYYIIMSIAIGVVIVADIVMYEFWQFKLSSVVLAYAAYPEGTANSVAPSFVATRLGAGIAFMVATIAGCIWATPRRVEPLANRRYAVSISIFCFAVLAATTRFDRAYDSQRIFLNHAAVNPVLGFVSSFSIHDCPDRYDYYDEDKRAETMHGLYEHNGAGSGDTGVLTDTLLRTQRPDVLVVFVESFGSEFVTSLGGAKGTTPEGRIEDVDQQLERLIPEGIFWTNYYSNSFRTDRGTVSAFCGWPAYTDVGLMTRTDIHHSLPSLPKSLSRVGYDTSFMYPGAMTNMGKGTFLGNIGFSHLIDGKAFTPDELDSAWGACDMTSARKVAQLLTQVNADEKVNISDSVSDSVRIATRQPRLFCYQTVSSHEPWTVPYERLTDKVQNAFAYTDAAIGTLIRELKASPVWDNLLVVIIPDHGHLYKVRTRAKGEKHPSDQLPLHRQAFDDPEFFHSPMLWLGGAVREPRRMDVLMNQSDLCATLLGQLGVDHSDYPWSRDVLSSSYRYPFVYSVFPAGLLYRDASGTTIYDVSSETVIMQRDAGCSPHYGPSTLVSKPGADRIRRAKSILQTTYDGL